MNSKYLMVRIEAFKYAIDVLDLKEILRTKDIVLQGIPKAPNGVIGALNIRGTFYPVLNKRNDDNIDECRILVIKANGTYIGLVVDEVIGHNAIMEDELGSDVLILASNLLY